MSRPSYVEDVAYDQTVDTLARAGRMDRDEVMLILGEVGNIWPRSILREVIASATAEIERRV
jgi:hypothetical protein